MIIGIIKETSPFETRVAATPQTTARFHQSGFTVMVEHNAGKASGFKNEAYLEAGAVIQQNAVDVLRQADVLLKIQAPALAEIKRLKPHAVIIGDFQNLSSSDALEKLKSLPVTCFALEKLPRLSRAQPFDILSSQNNLAGYQAVIRAAGFSSRIIPLMITSAGTIPPLKFLIVGVGVAGLQAIATAKRLGGKVYASDTREEVKDQVKSLGASFIEDITPFLPQADVIITSAFSAGKKAPLLITRNMLRTIPQGAVLIDMAAGFGGNIEGSVNFKAIYADNCIIYGNSNLAADIPASASLLFANNLYNFLMYIYSPEQTAVAPDFNDPLISETCIVKG